ncbi:MAG: hypothetical protein IJW73_09320 [Candidatus Gastranaerophilales bacterium]|nr:hypothetical protein [Candidatus Gastranaerophilales bacterium]
MLEDLLTSLIKPIKAIKLLNILLEEVMEDETIYNINKNQYEKIKIF